MFVPPKLSSLKSRDGRLSTRVWVTGDDAFVYPEQASSIVRQRGSTGVAFSGGGNRAMVAAWGQLRGLVDSGLIDHIDYISCVSGGSWASTAFTYYQDGARDDAEFLGPLIEPDRIRRSELDRISPNTFGITATESFMSQLIEGAIHVPMGRSTPNDVWLHAVGRTFFERFGIYDNNRPSFFSYDAETVRDIVSRNPSLREDQFYTVRNRTGDARRPYLIINSTLIWPGVGGKNFVHFEHAPLSAGSKQRLTVYESPENQSGASATFGGGFIEPFAYGSPRPRSWPPADHCAAAADGCVYVDSPERPYDLAFASGTSSAAFAAMGATMGGRIPFFGQMTQQGPPLHRYWPVPALDSASTPQDELHTFGDGGSLENLGVIPLLVRGVQNLVVFVNTERRLDVDYDPSDPDNNPPSIFGLDGGVSPLFGIPPVDRKQPPTPNNQVFRKDDFATVVRALQRAHSGRRGEVGPCIVKTPLEVQPNDWWGIKGGYTANVCWVYLERVSEWESRLDPELGRLLAAAYSADSKEKVPFWGFPNYKTMFQGGKSRILAMHAREANLLADFTAWVTARSTRSRVIEETLLS